MLLGDDEQANQGAQHELPPVGTRWAIPTQMDKCGEPVDPDRGEAEEEEVADVSQGLSIKHQVGPPPRIPSVWYSLGLVGSSLLFLSVMLIHGQSPILSVVAFASWALVAGFFKNLATGVPVGGTLLATRRSRRTWTIHARVGRLRSVALAALAKGDNPGQAVALRMASDLRTVDGIFPDGTSLQLETWMMRPGLVRRAEAAGWLVDPAPPLARTRLMDMRLAWALMPHSARTRIAGPFAKGALEMRRLTKTVASGQAPNQPNDLALR